MHRSNRQSDDRHPGAAPERLTNDGASYANQHARGPTQILGLQRSVGNAAVQRLLDGDGVQRAPDTKPGGRRQVSAAVSVVWTEDSSEFWWRVAKAVERQLRLYEGAVRTHLLALGPSIHSRYQMKHHPKVGQSVRFQVSLMHDPSEFHSEVSDVQVSAVTTDGGKADAAKSPPTPPREDLKPKAGEKPGDWLMRQARYVVRFGSDYVAWADKEGYDGVKMTVYYTPGPAVYIAAIERVGEEPKERAAGTAPKIAATIAADLGPTIDQLLIGRPRQVHIAFGRDQRGVMQDGPYRAEALPPDPKPPVTYVADKRSERERLKDYGILDPKQHWKESFEKTEQEVKDIAIKAVTFAVTEIATMLVVGGILKILGAGIRRLPNLYRLIRGNKAKELAEGLARLSKAEADEFGWLMDRVNRGQKLSPDEVKRLEALATKLDDALAPGATTGQQAVSTGGGAGSTRTTGVTSTADDAAKGTVGSQATELVTANINYNKQLSTAGWRSSLQGEGYGVFEGRIPGMKDPVAVKVYPKGHAKFADDMAGAEVAAKTGYGPKFYGQVNEPGKQAFAMEKLPGAQIDAGSGGAAAIAEAKQAASYVTKQTVRDLDAYAQKMLDQGYYHTGDVQGLVDSSGRWRAIDFQTVKKLPPTTNFQARQEAIRSHWADVKLERNLLEAALRSNGKGP